MTTTLRNRAVVFVAFGLLSGVGLDSAWRYALTPVHAEAQRGAQPPQPQPAPPQQAPQVRTEAAPTIESLSRDVARLTALLPSNSHIMMDVQWHWTNLWFAGQAKNWPLALYQFNEARGHIQWLTRRSPIIRSSGPNREDVDIEGIFGGIDTSSLADVKTAIDQKDGVKFAAAYKSMLESCYSCHKSVGRPYLRPQIPKASMQAILNMDPNATWPQ